MRIERDTPADAPEDVEMGGEDAEVAEVLEVEAPTGEAQAEAEEAIDEAAQAAANMSFLESVPLTGGALRSRLIRLAATYDHL